MNALLVAVGSHGDVHPFVGLGIRLLARGHRVTVVTNPHFAPMIERAGLGFLPLGTAEEYRRLAGDPDLWHPFKAFGVVARAFMPYVRPTYDHVAGEFARDKSTVVVASTLALGARVAQEALGVPMASVHLSPAVFASLHDTPPIPGLHLAPWLPRFAKRFLLHTLAHRLIVGRAVGRPLNAVRAALGLAPVTGVMMHWWNSPQLVLAMFPDWYAAPQPDWPMHTRVAGFPLYDERGLAPLSAALLQFLDNGAPPIAFTPGSAMWQGRDFFAASAEACRLLGRRGLLLSRHADHIPATLPPGVIHVDYAPFSELLPRCAALVHHGGIGTSAQALAAGAPQLVMPMAHDQPDNAVRLRKLGVADAIAPARYRADRVAAKLRRLLQDPAVAADCRTAAGRFVDTDALGEACRHVESLGPAQSKVTPGFS